MDKMFAYTDISEFPRHFLKLDALTVLSIQTVLQDFVPQLSGWCCKILTARAGEGVTMVGEFAARTWLAALMGQLWKSYNHRAQRHLEIRLRHYTPGGSLKWKMGDLSLVKDAGALFGTNCPVDGGIITLQKHIWFSCLQLSQFLFDDLVLCSPFNFFSRIHWLQSHVWHLGAASCHPSKTKVMKWRACWFVPEPRV